MKKIKTEKLYYLDNIELPLVILIKNLQVLANDFKNYKKLRIEVEDVNYDATYVDYYIVGDREETDEEYEKRLREEREKVERLEFAKQKKIDDAYLKQQEKIDKELKKLAQLKEKYEKDI